MPCTPFAISKCHIRLQNAVVPFVQLFCTILLASLVIGGFSFKDREPTKTVIVNVFADEAVVVNEETLSFKMGEMAIDELPNLATNDARVAPVFEGGRMVGFKLVAVRPMSFLNFIGLQDGDIVRYINDRQLNSPNAPLDAFTAHRHERDFYVGFTRCGRPHVTIVHLR